MKPKTIDSILDDFVLDFDIANNSFMANEEARKQVKQQLIELFMNCVPEDKDDSFNDIEAMGWNDCRDQMIKNLEKLK